jgi:hypothetical protein
LGSDQTSYIIRTQEDIIQHFFWGCECDDGRKPIFKERYRKHYAVTPPLSINSKGTYFFDYGNAFLLEASRAGADIMADNHIDFKYSSYVQDIMGPMCFDYGLVLSLGLCFRKTGGFTKTDTIACQC